MTIAEAGRQLGYARELGDKGNGRVGLKSRGSDLARSEAERIQRGDATRYRPPSVPGMDRHHKRMIMLYKPLFKGLSEADALALSRHAASRGMNLGDVDANFEYLRKKTHDKLHRYMEQQGMRPSLMPDFSQADLINRKKAFDVLYKDFIQADIDKFLKSLSKGQAINARNPNQITVREDLSMRRTPKQGDPPKLPNTTAPQSSEQPETGIPGFSTSEQPGPQTTAPQSRDDLFIGVMNLGNEALKIVQNPEDYDPTYKGVSATQALSIMQRGYGLARTILSGIGTVAGLQQRGY